MSTTSPFQTTNAAVDIDPIGAADFMDKYYLTYVLYTIKDRAIPSAADGLKPGQRRLLYRFYLDKLAPTAKTAKCSKISSATSGTLHPHGDASIYGTLASMAAPYRRARLIEPHGSMGTYPGDEPASPRYTEARLSTVGWETVKELSTGHPVDMVPTFDGDLTEPVYLPTRFPTLLVNGASGMAVGWGTNVPAHNPRELMDVCTAMLDNPDMSVEDIRKIMPAPDWGTGGIIVGDQGIDDYMSTGKGKITVRGEAHIEGKTIVITSLPPEVTWTTLNDKLRKGTLDGSLEGISDIANLSSRTGGFRFEVTVKNRHKPEVVLQQLYTKTPLESTFAASLVALDEDKVPRWWTLPELLRAFLNLRDQIVENRSQSRLGKVEQRHKEVDALLLVVADIDKVISIVRSSDNADTACQKLMHEFGVDEEQGRYILSMPLRRLTSQDSLELKKEAKALKREAAHLRNLIRSPKARAKVIRGELEETKKVFGQCPRLTQFNPEAKPTVAPTAAGGSGGSALGWRLTSDGMFTPTRQGIQFDGAGWAVFGHGRLKLMDGKGLPKRGRDIPLAPDVSDLVTCGVGDATVFVFVTAKGRLLHVDASDVGRQGVAGKGVAGMKLDKGDRVVFAAPADQLKGGFTTEGPKGVKKHVLGDFRVKGRGTQGVWLRRDGVNGVSVG